MAFARVRRGGIWAIVVALAAGNGAAAGHDDFESMSLRELLNVPVKVASKTAMTARSSPGIVTVISREEIITSGARDLVDVLRLVPGFVFGVDVEGVVGIGERGNWGHEGKILLLIDGIEMNEYQFSTLQFGNHYPVESIERIEIIRGPGSAIYGGYAELAVINIVTRTAADVDGAEVSVTWGQMSDATARTTGTIAYGTTSGDLEFVLHGMISEGVRSDATYTDFFGSSYDMGDDSDLDPTHLNLGLGYKGFSARLIWDDYDTTERDVYDEVFPHAIDTDFETLALDASYEIAVGDTLTLTPRVTWVDQSAWQSKDPIGIDLETFWEVPMERLTFGLSSTWKASDAVDVLAGVEHYEEEARFADDIPDDYNTFFNGEHSVDFDNTAVYGQAQVEVSGANLIVGARWEDHSQFGSSFVPRAGVTKTWENAHFKVLFSKAFRAPAVMNINTNPEIEPEETTVFEIEGGYQVSENSYLTANVFQIEIDQPIVFYYDPVTEAEAYLNFDRTGTRGLEIEYRTKAAWGYSTVDYSYYQADDNRVELYAVPGDDDRLLGFPTHKLTWSAGFKLAKGISVGPSLVYMSERAAYTSADEDEVEQIDDLDEVVLANVFLELRDRLAPGLDVGFGIYDLFGEEYAFAQPYDGFHAPLPGPTREYLLRVRYHFGE